MQVPAANLRRALVELPGVSEPLVNAFIMRRQRLMRDREFAGFRVIARRDSREGHQLHDFLTKNHVPHRLIEFEDEQGQALARRFNLTSRDLPTLITATGAPLRKPSLREVAQIAGLLRPLATVTTRRKFIGPDDRWRGSRWSGSSGLRGLGGSQHRRARKLRTGRAGRLFISDREFFRLPNRDQRRRSDLSRAASGLSLRRKILDALTGPLHHYPRR